MAEARYRPGQSNHILRHMLITAWGGRCYWCTRLIEDDSAEIDHIVPQDASQATLAEMKRQFALPGDYDLHAPYNLAPICGRCNKEKNNADLTSRPRIASLLEIAMRLAPQVEHDVRAFASRRGLSNALLKAAETDFSDEKARGIFEAGAPAIVQRLARLDAAKADFFVSKKMTIEIDEEYHRLELVLDERSRAAVTIFEQVARGNLADTLQVPLAEFAEQTGAEATRAMEVADELRGADVEPLAVSCELIVDQVEFQRGRRKRLKFALTGALHADGSTTIARDDIHGDGVEYVQGDAYITARFKVMLSWGLDDPAGKVVVDGAELDVEHIEVSNAEQDDDLFDFDVDVPQGGP